MKQIDDLMIKLILEAITFALHIYSFFFQGEQIFKSCKILRTSTRRLRDPVAGFSGDQMIGRSRDVRGT